MPNGVPTAWMAGFYRTPLPWVDRGQGGGAVTHFGVVPDIGARAGYCLLPELPRTAREAHVSIDALFTDARRVFFASRGVRDAISSAGPHVGFAHDAADIDVYLGVLDDFLEQLCAA
jgi:hypothetical protein